MNKRIILSMLLVSSLTLTACGGNTSSDSSNSKNDSLRTESSAIVTEAETTVEDSTTESTMVAEITSAVTEEVINSDISGQTLVYENVDIRDAIANAGSSCREVPITLEGIDNIHQYLFTIDGETGAIVWTNDSDKYVVIDRVSGEKSAEDEDIQALLAPGGCASRKATFSPEDLGVENYNYAYEMTEDTFNNKINKQTYMSENAPKAEYADAKRNLDIIPNVKCSVTEVQDEFIPSMWKGSVTYSGLDEWCAFSNEMTDKYSKLDGDYDRNMNIGSTSALIMIFGENGELCFTWNTGYNASNAENGEITDKLQVCSNGNGKTVVAVPYTTNSIL